MAANTGASTNRLLNKLAYAVANNEISDAGVLSPTDRAIVSDTSADGAIKYADPFRIPVNADVAAAGSVLADAAQLLVGFTVVTGANGTLGVKLPATPIPGTIVIIKGTTAGVLKVWPDAAATINAVGSNGAMSLASGVIPAIFIAKSATQWYTIPLLPS